GKINYKMRDAIFSRQRYWGEPIPIRFENEIPIPLSTSELPLLLPEIDKYQPTENGEPPLGRSKEFAEKNYELNTMPGWAGSSWYFLRYMDANNKEQLVSNEAQKYWNQVDLYIGGSEHATGHLLYSRFWNLFLYDLNYIDHAEPFKKLINQGMIQGRSSFVYRINGQNKFVSYNLKKDYDVQAIHVDISLVNHDILDLEAFKNWRADFNNAEFILEDGKYHCGYEIEKMSKSKYNVVNPDDIVEKYGADTLRMYEMFLGPLEQFKPWNTHGIDGVFRFIRKLWRLVYDEQGKLILNNEEPSKEALKILHKTIKKIEDDIEKFSFNTSVSSFMICVNTLQELKCHNRQIIHDLVITLSPFAPFITEEIWHSAFGYNTSISHANFPVYNESYIIENEFEYPISINGKVRSKIKLPLELSKEEIEKIISNSDTLDKWLEGKTPKKIIVVHGKIVNLVL
ncbi:MAG: leucine--tRNA ligase, partial [Cytophagales bacterium]